MTIGTLLQMQVLLRTQSYDRNSNINSRRLVPKESAPVEQTRHTPTGRLSKGNDGSHASDTRRSIRHKRQSRSEETPMSTRNLFTAGAVEGVEENVTAPDYFRFVEAMESVRSLGHRRLAAKTCMGDLILRSIKKGRRFGRGCIIGFVRDRDARKPFA